MAEYAWQQPDGEIAPVLATEGYDLMVNIVGDWVRVADLVKLALKPGQFTVGPEPLTGEALDAERRGDHLGCAHAVPWYWDEELGRSRCARCDAVVGPDRAKDQQDIVREMTQKEV